MASRSSKAPGTSNSSTAPDNTPHLIVIRSVEAQQTFVAKSLEKLELLGQHQTPSNNATVVMDAGFQIESEASNQGYRVIATTARSLSMQAAELYLRNDSAMASTSIKNTIDLLSVLLLRVYITGSDVDSSESFAQLSAASRLTDDHGCVH